MKAKQTWRCAQCQLVTWLVATLCRNVLKRNVIMIKVRNHDRKRSTWSSPARRSIRISHSVKRKTPNRSMIACVHVTRESSGSFFGNAREKLGGYEGLSHVNLLRSVTAIDEVDLKSQRCKKWPKSVRNRSVIVIVVPAIISLLVARLHIVQTIHIYIERKTWMYLP